MLFRSVVATLLSSSSTSTVTIANAEPAVLVPGHASAYTSNATMISRLPPDKILGLTIALRPKSDQALANALALAQNRAPNRLTVDELGSAVGQSSVNLATITSFFRAAGMTVGPLAADQLSFRVTGTVANLEKALSVTFGNYVDRAGNQFFSTDGEPGLPTDVAPLVQVIYGLDNFPDRKSVV